MEISEEAEPAEELTRSELIARLRPGGWSRLGFLGDEESLDEVLAQDAETITQLGVSYGDLADKLEHLLETALEMYFDTTVEVVETSFPDLYNPETIPHFDLENLPDIRSGFLVDHLQIFLMVYRGWQVCPWGCDARGSYDFMIVNRSTGESVTGPELIPHLIRDHHFFEGLDTPFRSAPAQIASVLGLAGGKRRKASTLA